MCCSDINDFKIGDTILHGSREYTVIEVLGHRTIRVGISEIDLGSKDVLRKCLETHPDDYAFCIAKWFIVQKRLTHSSYHSVRMAVPETQKIHIRRMVEIDKLEPMDIIDLFHYALNDKFWKDNLLTISALRHRSTNKLMKWENIRRAMINDKKRNKYV